MEPIVIQPEEEQPESPDVNVTVNLPETPDPSPATPPESPRSESASEQHAQQLKVLRENQELIFQQMQQQVSMLQTERDAQRQVMQEMLETMKIVQQIAADWDTNLQRFGEGIAALIRLEMLWRQRLQPRQQGQQQS